MRNGITTFALVLALGAAAPDAAAASAQLQAAPGPAPVKPVAPAPRPSVVPPVVAVAGEDEVDLNFKDADLLDVLRMLGQMGHLNVMADQGVSGKVTLYLQSIPVMAAVELVTRTTGYSYHLAGNTLVVGTSERIQAEFGDQSSVVTLPVHHLALADAAKAINLAVDQGQVIPIANTNSLLVRGTPAQIQAAASLLKQLDVAPALQLDYVDKPVLDVMRDLAKSAGYSLIVDGAVRGNVSVYLTGIDPAHAIDLVAKQAGLDYQITPQGVLTVSPKPAPVSASPEVQAAVPAPAGLRLWTPRFIAADAANKLVTSAFPDVQVTPTGTGTLVLHGAEPVLAKAITLLDDYDVPSVVLTGVVRSGDHYQAIVSIQGQEFVVSTGERALGLTVASIDADSIELTWNQHRVTAVLGDGA